MYKVEKIINDIKFHKLYPIYFLMGDEIYFIDLISDYIRKYLLNNEIETFFDQKIFYGKNIDINNLFSILNKLPVIGKYNIVIIKDAQEMSNIECLIEYIKKPILTTILVICYKNKFLDKKHKIYNIINNYGLIFYSKKYNYSEIPKWIRYNVKLMGYYISEEAVYMLKIFFGKNISLLKKELDKLSINLEKGSKINKDIIISSFAINEYYNIYELEKYILERNREKIYKILYFISNNMEKYYFNDILNKIINIYINIMKCFLDINFIKNNNIPSILINNYKNSILEYSLYDVIKIISFLREADMQSKNIELYKLNNIEILKELFFKIFNLNI